jgi:hypothetical protein
MDSGNDGGDGADPRPKRPEGNRRPKEPPPPKVTPAVRREIEEKLTALLEFFALGMQFRDPVCGQVLEDESANITRRMVTVICRRPRWVAWFTEGADYQDWLMLATALQPVAVSLWSHHVVKDGGGGELADDDDLSRYAAPAAA